MLTSSQIIEQRVAPRSIRSDFSEINRLLAAAVVSRKFCALLLSDPARAIAQGYAGEQFFLSADEYNLVLFAERSSLQEFARQLCEYAPGQPRHIQPVLSPDYSTPYSMPV
ncbi:MAG: hypothetical protein EHM81_02650 [Chloroflexi bacterium]|nr:MAG: hypothetical protein EHM81_02650 [Chloroflexota bacterium]